MASKPQNARSLMRYSDSDAARCVASCSSVQAASNCWTRSPDETISTPLRGSSPRSRHRPATSKVSRTSASIPSPRFQARKQWRQPGQTAHGPHRWPGRTGARRDCAARSHGRGPVADHRRSEVVPPPGGHVVPVVSPLTGRNRVGSVKVVQQPPIQAGLAQTLLNCRHIQRHKGDSKPGFGFLGGSPPRRPGGVATLESKRSTGIPIPDRIRS